MDAYDSAQISEQTCYENADFDYTDEIGDPPDVTEGECYNENVDERGVSMDYNQQLRDRIILLRAMLYDLRKQIKEERDHCRREILYANESPTDSFVETLRYAPTLTYEEISQLHRESKAQLQRQLAITNYKRRLLEVENMCNVELMRVKQNVKFLQPLQLMISEWNLDGNANNHVDQAGDHLSIQSSREDLTSETDLKTRESSSNIPLELISTKLYNDMNDMFNVLSAHCQETVPNWNQDNTLQSQSSDIFSDCGQSELM